jgi:hypothetical protein
MTAHPIAPGGDSGVERDMATPTPDEKSLLLSKRLENVVTDPFCFFYVDDYLPSDLYQSLLASFPDESHYTYNQEGKMGFRSSEDPDEVESFAAAHPEWQQLIEFFSSDDFVYDARETLAEALVNARGLSTARAGRFRTTGCATSFRSRCGRPISSPCSPGTEPSFRMRTRPESW